MGEDDFGLFNFGMPSLFPFEGEEAVIAIGNDLPEDLRDGDVAIADFSDGPGFGTFWLFVEIVLDVDVPEERLNEAVEVQEVVAVGFVAVFDVPEDACGWGLLEGVDNRFEGLDGIEVAMDFEIDMDGMVLSIFGDLADGFGDLVDGLGFLSRIWDVVAEDAERGDIHSFEDIDGVFGLLDILPKGCFLVKMAGRAKSDEAKP